MAAIAPTHLTSDAVAGTSTATTASVSPSAGKFYTVFCRGRANSGTPAVTSVVGCGLTWTQVISSVVATTSGIFMFRGEGNPSAGTIVITFDRTISTIAWTVDEWDSVASGVDGVVQSVSNSSGDSTSFSVTAAALGSVNNVLVGFLDQYNQIATLTLGSGQSAVHNYGFDGDDSWLVQWKLNTTTSDCTSNLNKAWNGIAAELRFRGKFSGAMI